MCTERGKIILAFFLICQLTAVQLSFIEKLPLKSSQDEELFNEAMLETTEFVKFYGYPCENHTVHTKDGFILTVHRIPHGIRNHNTTGKRKPVFLLHGLLVTSSLFVDSGKPSLGFYLADKGYDVWLGNMRGSFYSHHKKYSRKDKEFWDFSWEEIAKYDAPAMIDYVLKSTGSTQIPYIAHSMGTTVGLALFSSRPEFEKKVSGFIALSPVGSLKYAPTLYRAASSFKSILNIIAKLIRLYNPLGLDPTYFKIQAFFCPYPKSTLCALNTNLFGGYSKNTRNDSRDFLYTNHAASGTSLRTLLHMAQMIQKEGMYTYDYGPFANFFRKDKRLPPTKYRLDKIAMPVVIFHSANDALSDPIDVQLLARSLKNLIGIELVGSTTMNHVDMTYALDAKNIYQDKLLTYLEKL